MGVVKGATLEIQGSTSDSYLISFNRVKLNAADRTTATENDTAKAFACDMVFSLGRVKYKSFGIFNR